MKTIESSIHLGEIIPNISILLQRNAELWKDHNVFTEYKNGTYVSIKWKDFYKDIQNIASNLKNQGFKEGDKMIIFSPNKLEMLELELAVMSMKGIVVPLFAYFHQETAELLIKHSGANFAAIDNEIQWNRIKYLNLELVISFNPSIEMARNTLPFVELLKSSANDSASLTIEIDSDFICLNMYTSGTMGTPKCVQLSHRNILSQQAALIKMWNIDHTDRFLSYLPWHHSFGGIFELFTALSNGAEMILESSYGKDPTVIMQHWKNKKPTLFFSVPKVYQALYELAKKSKETEEIFFHSNLKFIFTAAASLPQTLSDEFERRNIPVIEGWGLTETSPCCTLTDPSKKRKPGVVGFPIPGVQIAFAPDGEILVKGPNVMKAYYNNAEANRGIFTEDGWFRTGDIGEYTENGLKLITRKDRIFKLSNGEKVIPSDLEKLIEVQCPYVLHALIAGEGEEYPVALLFPNKKLLDDPDYFVTLDDGCFCPRSLEELSRCLKGCLHDANCSIGQKFSKIQSAVIIDDELSFDNGTLTSSMKASPKNILQVYKAQLKTLYTPESNAEDVVYIIRLDDLNKIPGRKINVDYV
ncbi:MAG: AMP-binding protein [Saprospiraceae bacterium]|nr:AMP-binding protein [Saprospiraceae bacterium]